MIYEQTESFLNNLIFFTKKKLLRWEPLSSFPQYSEFVNELEYRSDIDFAVNSINKHKSYYLNHNEGYVFVFYIYHGDPDITSPKLDSLALMVKANTVVPIYNLTSNMITKEHQHSLETLRLLIEHYLEEKYSMPETLYRFMKQVIDDAEKRENNNIDSK